MDKHFFLKAYPWISSTKTRFLQTLALGCLVIFILIFLQPFDTGEKHLPNKNIMLAGYGLCVVIADFLLLWWERIYFFQFKKPWTKGSELIYLIALLLLSSVLVYSYDLAITKHHAITWDNLWVFSYQFILPVAALLLPALTYFRFIVGTKRSVEQIQNPLIHLQGQNKEDDLKIRFQQLLYIKAEDNYVKVCYLTKENAVAELLMRNTLSEISQQAPSLVYAHRSYLVSPLHIKKLQGHKQKASLLIQHVESEIPVSAKYFASFKRLPLV